MPYAEVFDRDRVLAQLEWSRAAIEKHLADGGRPMQVDGETASEEELREVLPEIEASLERERTRSGGMQAEGVYLPSDPLISCLQSGVDRGIAERTDKPSLADLVKESDGDLVEGMAGRDGPLPPVTDLHIPPELEEEEAEIDVEPGSYKPFPIDPGWAIVAITISLRALRGKYPYNPKPAKAALNTSARLFLFSDWGSGIERAVSLSGEVRSQIRAEPDKEDHVIHLGDVYYAGWPHEYRDHVLAAWPVPATQPDLAQSWILCGNHDMYYGGKGYYETCLSDQRFSGQRSDDGKPTSLFELSNEHWRVLGLDTGWVDVGLWDGQREWLKQAIVDAEDNGQSVLLLSHHQLFSGFGDHIDLELENELRDFLDQHPVRSWFWGHEHRCTVYKKSKQVGAACCIGNGGVPAHPTPKSALKHPEIVKLDYEKSLSNDPDWVRFAFARLEFSGAELVAVYCDEDGNEFLREDL
jgi:3',5'-cyclic AMP phosphodiesterase CpdA